MKSMKFVIGLLAAVALLSVSCEKTKEQTKKNPYDGVSMTFTLAMNKVESNSAEIRVRYTASQTLTWYYYLSDDLDSSLEDLVADGVALLDKSTTLEKLKSKVISVSDLEVETDYRFVVFGVAFEDDGTAWTYGTPAEISFKTSKDLNVVFSATEPVVERNSAKFTVSYDVDEDAEYTWYALLTKTISGTTANVIKSEVKNIPADQLKSGKDVEISLSDLDFSTTYRIIVTGLLEDGTTYGTAADLTFQIGDKFFLESAWTLSHSIDETTYPGYPHKFTNTVAAGSNAGKYFITLYAESEIEDTSDLPAFIDAVLPDEVEYLEYLAEQNNKTLSYYLTAGTGSEWYKVGYKKYYVFAIGLTDEGEATGAYAYMTYYNEPDETAKAEYDKWLGNWFLGEDLIPITVSEEEKCVSYRVNGFLSELVADGFLASFNATTYGFDFYGQSCEEYTHQTYGPVDVQLNGCKPSSDGDGYTPISGSYVIGSAVMSADGHSADITPKTIELSNGTEVTLSGMNYYGHILTGQYAGYYLTYTIAKDPLLFPTTMVRPSETGSEAYNKWLGTWEIKRPEYTESTQTEDGVPTGNYITDEWVIEQDFADITYTISGIDGYGGESISATFDSATGGITVSEQGMGSFENGGSTYSKYLMGLFNANGSIWGGTEKIFSGVINPDGSATLTGLEFSGESTTGPITETFTGMEIFAVDESDSISGYGADNWGEFYTFPCNITKKAASGTSVRMKKTSGKKVSVKRTPHLFKPFSSADLIFGSRLGKTNSKVAATGREVEKKIK